MRLNAVVAVAVASFIAILGGIGYALYDGAQARCDTTRQVNQVRSVLIDLIDRGDGNLRKYRHEGLINQSQYARSLRISQDARTKLAPLPCQ